MLNFLPPIPCITGPCPFFLAFLPQWGISGKSWWGCATRFSKSWSYFRQKLSLSKPVFRPKITYICLKSYQIRILSCFLVHLELKWQIRLYTPVVPLKTIPGSRPKCAKSILFFSWDWNGPITLSFEAVHIYMASKREYHPRGFLPLDFFQLQNITRKLWLPALLELPPLISLLQPIVLGSLPTPCSLWAPYLPPTHISPVAYPSELPNPRPLPPMSALEESITEILQCPYYNFKET